MARGRWRQLRVPVLLGASSLVALGCGQLLGFEDFTRNGATRGDCQSDGDCNAGWMCVDGLCKTTCEPDDWFCTGSTLYRCNDRGTDRVSESEECATAELCAQAAATDEDDRTCPEPCEVGKNTCDGLQTDLKAHQCVTGQTWTTEDCRLDDRQCNPRTGECFELAIDTTEVTRQEYEKFLVDAASQPPLQPSGCEWNEALAPDEDCTSDDRYCKQDCANHPQSCIDWCDAYAYCEWAGKRLCGKIGSGAPVDFESEYADAGVSEWMNACTGGGQFEQAYLGTAESCAYEATATTTYEVGTHAGCSPPAAGYGHIHDLSGNVAEWENNCEKAASAIGAGADDGCRARGGSFQQALENLDCRPPPGFVQARSETWPWLGFRCCGGPPSR